MDLQCVRFVLYVKSLANRFFSDGQLKPPNSDRLNERQLPWLALNEVCYFNFILNLIQPYHTRHGYISFMIQVSRCRLSWPKCLRRR